MSIIKIPSRSEGKLPSIISESDENLQPVEITFRKCRQQAVASIIICLGVFSLGSVFGWSAIAIPDLIEGKAIKFSEAAMTSIFIIGALLSGPVAGYCMLKLGRKNTIFGYSIILLLGWILIPFAEVVKSNARSALSFLYIGRFITGFAGAGCFTIAPVYVQEVCDERIRTVLGSFVPLFLVLGNLYPIVLGSFVGWFEISIACCVIPPVLVGLVWFIPETPRYLLMADKPTEARVAFDWLNAGFPEEERDRLFKRVKLGVELLSSKRAMKRSKRKQQEARKRLTVWSRPVLHPLILSVLLILFQQSSGTNIVTTYTVDILNGGSTPITAKTGTLLTAIIFAICVLGATAIVERFKRRTLILTSSVIMGFMFAALGFYFYFKEAAKNNGWGWVPLATVLIITAAYSFGLGSVSWIVVTEISHPDFQEISGTLASTTYWLIAFVVTLTYPYLREGITYHWTFWMYAVICFSAGAYVYFVIFETHGRSQVEIMAHYLGQGSTFFLNDDDDADAISLGSITRKTLDKNKRFSAESRGSSATSDRSDSVDLYNVFTESGSVINVKDVALTQTSKT